MIKKIKAELIEKIQRGDVEHACSLLSKLFNDIGDFDKKTDVEHQLTLYNQIKNRIANGSEESGNTIISSRLHTIITLVNQIPENHNFHDIYKYIITSNKNSISISNIMEIENLYAEGERFAALHLLKNTLPTLEGETIDEVTLFILDGIIENYGRLIKGYMDQEIAFTRYVKVREETVDKNFKNLMGNIIKEIDNGKIWASNLNF